MLDDSKVYDIELTAEDFNVEEFNKNTKFPKNDNLFELDNYFLIMANKSFKKENYSQCKIYWIFHDICSMMLIPSSRNEPLQASYIGMRKRSAIPGDFTNKDLEFLISILDLISNPLIKSRVADILWLEAEKENIKYCNIAIESYKDVPLRSNEWSSQNRNCIDRALKLSAMTKSFDKTKEIKEILIKEIMRPRKKNIEISLWLSDLLVENDLEVINKLEIAKKLERVATSLLKQKVYDLAIDCYFASSKWYDKDKNTNKKHKLIIKAAETYEEEANNSKSNAISASFYEKAIQVYRLIPNAIRKEYGVDNKIISAHEALRKSGEKTAGEMKSTGSSIDISDIIKEARKFVTKKTPIKAFRSFVNLREFFNYQELTKRAIDHIKKAPTQYLFPSIIISADGRTIKKLPSFDLKEPLTTDNPAVKSAMMRDYNLQLSILTNGGIAPAYEILHQEHHLNELDFFSFVRHSPIIPPNRVVFFSKALFSGYDRDFMTALHILCPQVEHMVRYHLKNAEVITTHLDSLGIEQEKGLSSLVELPEMIEIFGEDISFEIKALFCDPEGANFRNDVAHGLAEYDSYNSTHALYAWWFILKLVFNTFWNNLSKTKNEINAK